MDTASRDENRNVTIQGVSTIDQKSPTNIAVNPVSKALVTEVIPGAELLPVTLVDTDGNAVSVSGGTQYTEDVAAAANPVGTALNLVRADSLSGLTTTNGDNVAARGTDKGELYVKQTDTVPVSQVNATRPASTTMQNAATATGVGSNLSTDGYATALLSVTNSGTPSWTISFEATTDGIQWVPIAGERIGLPSGSVSNGASGITSPSICYTTTTVGDFRFNVAGYAVLRARISAYTSGTITVYGYVYSIAGQPSVVRFAGQDSVDATRSVVPYVDPTNHSLLITGEVEIVGGVSGASSQAEDAPAPGNPSGDLLMSRRRDTLDTAEVDTDGDVIAVNSTRKGELYVKHTDSVAVTSATLATTAKQDTGNTSLASIDSNTGYYLTFLPAINGATKTDDTAFSPAVGNVMMAGFEYDDTSPDSVDEGDGGAARMSANRNQYMQIRDAAGNERGVNVNASNQLTVSVDNTVTVGSHAITNAGTFVVQENGAALTSLQLIDDVVYTDDTSTHATGTSKGALLMAAATPTDAAVNANDIGAVAMTTDRKLHVSVQDALPAGSAAIGKLAANSGVDIGDVDVTTVGTITPGTAASSLGKAEDAAHASADVGVMALAVRSNTAASTSGTDGDYQPLITNTTGHLWVDASGQTLTVGSHAVTNAGTFAVQATLQTQTDTVMVGGVNVKEINGVAPLMGVGVTGTGAQRVVIANDTGRTLVSTGGSASSSGNNTLVAAGTNKLKVYAFSLSTVSTTAVTCIFQSGASGTELWRVILQTPASVAGGANLVVQPPAWLFATASATLLNLNLSAAVAVNWSVAYYDEA